MVFFEIFQNLILAFFHNIAICNVVVLSKRNFPHCLYLEGGGRKQRFRICEQCRFGHRFSIARRQQSVGRP